MGTVRNTVEKAIRIGELLLRAKASMKHGQWLPWLEKNIQFSRQTPDNYVRCFNHKDQLESKLPKLSNLSEAYALLSDGSDHKERKQRLLNFANLPDAKYRVIYADPPWEYNDKCSITLTRGMEFGVSPFPETRRAMIERNGLFGVPGYRWIPARRTVTVEYRIFLLPADSVPETLPIRTRRKLR